jgi:hypothetical protein
MQNIVRLEGDALAAFMEMLERAYHSTERDVYRLRFALDGDQFKMKVNEGMWTAGLGAVIESAS